MLLSFHARANDLHCLTQNIYYEAKGEPKAGQLAVAFVTLNRSKNRSVCDAVFEKYQFSWTLNYSTNVVKEEWLAAMRVAKEALNTKNYFKATHFHSVNVAPKWAKQRRFIVQIGNHLFYD